MWPDPTGPPSSDGGYLRAAHTPGGNRAFHNWHNDFSHILDPNQRRRLALAEIDKVPFGWYHVRAVAVAGAGFFADSYDLFAINFALQMLGIAFWQDEGGRIPVKIDTAIKAATSVGAILGQVIFGWLADRLGRKRMYGVELIILIVATLFQSLSSPSDGVTISGLLIFGRVMMGLGIGGDYPMSAVITSEFAPTRWRGAMMASVFTMQGAGQFGAATVALLTTVGFKESFSSAATTADCTGDCRLAANRAWRIIIGAGILPAVYALYYRITVPETPRFTFDVARDIEKADADIKAYIEGQPEGSFDAVTRQQTIVFSRTSFDQPRSSWADFRQYFGQWRNGSVLFATMASWFFVDFAFYGLGLNNTTILTAIGYSTGPNLYSTLLNSAIGNLILVSAGSLPGYILSIIFLDTLGRRPLQITSFFLLALVFIIIGFGYDLMTKSTLLALYILAQFFFNFGPNTTTFIIPGECFPTRYRSTGHGLSAASGKLGATIAQLVAPVLLGLGEKKGVQGGNGNTWLKHLMEIFALSMVLGGVVSFLVPETKGRTLEGLAGEKEVGGRGGSGKGRSSPLLRGKNGVKERKVWKLWDRGDGKSDRKREKKKEKEKESEDEKGFDHGDGDLSTGIRVSEIDIPSPNGPYTWRSSGSGSGNGTGIDQRHREGGNERDIFDDDHNERRDHVPVPFEDRGTGIGIEGLRSALI